ncbi:MAG: hypothetical protein V1720_02105, partial [bacterium]
FFFCFAYLQFMSSINIRRYSLIIGCLIIGRVFYVVQLYSYMIYNEGFPSTFWFTGIVDTTFTILYIVFSFRGGLGVRDLFFPSRENN